jgi:hypothetical protein
MPTRGNYTTTDNAGFKVEKGDRVLITYEAEVRSIERDGRMVVLSHGFTTMFDPAYQGVVKIHNDGPKSDSNS